MFLRLLFVLLMALNIAVGAWLLLGQPYGHGGSPADPGVTELRLLSEVPETAASQPIPAAAISADPAPSGKNRCLTLGPFATPQDLRKVRQALAPETTRMRFRQEQATQTTGWWVYLPAQGSREQALALARKLGDRNIGDYFVVSNGEQPNAISLGLFKDPANARNRRDEVVRAGFPARMEERNETVPEYWLDLVSPESAQLDWRNAVADARVGSHTNACF